MAYCTCKASLADRYPEVPETIAHDKTLAEGTVDALKKPPVISDRGFLLFGSKCGYNKVTPEEEIPNGLCTRLRAGYVTKRFRGKFDY